MKWLVWLARWVVTVVAIAGLSLFSAWFVVNLYVEEIMKQYQIQNVGKKIQFSDVLARLGEELNIVKTRAAESASESAKGRAAPVTAQPATGGGATGTGGGTVGGDASNGGASNGDGTTTAKPSQTEEHVPEDAVAVTGRLSQNGSSEASGALGGMVMSTEDFAKKKAAMSSDDKMKLFSLLVNKLPPDQLQTISTMVEDGITSEELKKLDTTLQKYLSKDEYKQILDIIQK